MSSIKEKETIQDALNHGLNNIQLKCLKDSDKSIQVILMNEFNKEDTEDTMDGDDIDNAIPSIEDHEEYHIDVSQLDNNGLTAIRNNLDELFSEFDSRGQGLLQQDDIRRLILQWGGKSNPISESGLVSLFCCSFLFFLFVSGRINFF